MKNDGRECQATDHRWSGAHARATRQHAEHNTPRQRPANMSAHRGSLQVRIKTEDIGNVMRLQNCAEIVTKRVELQ